MKKNEQYLIQVQHFLHDTVDTYHNNQAIIKKAEQQKLKSEFQKLFQELDDQLPIYRVSSLFQLNGFAFFALLTLIIFEIDTIFWSKYTAIYKLDHLTLRYIISLYGCIHEVTVPQILYFLNDKGMNLLFKRQGQNMQAVLSKGLLIQDWCLHYICEGYLMNRDGVHILQKNDMVFYDIAKQEKTKIFHFLEEKESFILLGEKKTGKKSILQIYVNSFHKNLVVIDMENLSHTIWDEEFMYYILFAFYLHDRYGVILCSERDQKDNCLKLCTFLQNWNCSFVVVSNQMTSYVGEMPCIQLPCYLMNEEIEAICTKEQKSFPSVHRSWSITSLIKYLQNEVINDTLITSAFASSLPLDEKFEDWVGDEAMKKQIELILYFIQHQKVIQIKMALRRSGIQILFHGTSGTGKTMMAKIIASELKQSLYRVDLSMVNDKYIGESEKHLEQLFQQGAKSQSILLFDEADVLFAKRTDISNSNDRHANNMTAYLLQRLETYDGLIILTSNFIHNFDDAFLRRMQFIMKFDKPQQREREIKWKMLLKNFDYDGFTYTELSNISSLSLARMESALLIAETICQKNGESVMRRSHIYDGINIELSKQGDRIKDTEFARIKE